MRAQTSRSRRSFQSRFSSVAAILLSTPVLVIAQPEGWTQQATYPRGVDLESAYFLTPDHGFVVGHNQCLMETEDGGETWRTIFEGDRYSDPLYGVYFPDELHGYVVGNNQDAWRTTDGGDTWTQMTDVDFGSWWNMDFQTPTAGFIGANGAIAYTDDGGMTWDLRSGYPECPVIYGMDFRDANLGLVGGDQIGGGDNGIYRTTNGGRDWTRVLDITTNDVQFMTATTAIATVVGDLRIYRSTDAGLTWSPWSGTLPDDGPHNDLARIDDTTVACTGFDGDIWLSTDTGRTWTRAQEGLGDLPYDWRIQFHDSQTGAVVGPHGILWVTGDGGRTWELMTNGIGQIIEDIEMVDDFTGFAVAQNGYMLRTQDGGNRWSVRKLEVTGQIFGRDEGLQSLDVVDENTIVSGGHGGTVFRSLDGGDSWESIGYPKLPEALIINDVHFLSADEGYVVGQDIAAPRDQTVFYTDNGGASWSNPFLHGAIWERVHFMDDQRGIIMGTGGIYERTENGGQTWEEGFVPSEPLVNDMVFTDRDHGWIVGWWGYFAKTSDGGQTWEENFFNHEVRVAFSVVARDENEAWVLATNDISDPILLHTTNGGLSWSSMPFGDHPMNATELFRTSTGRMWAAGGQGVIYASDPVPPDAILLDVSELQRGAPADFVVTHAATGERAYFLYSLTGLGDGPCVPQLGGLCLDLLQPVKIIGSRLANEDGRAQLTTSVPPNAPRIPAYMQAAIRRGGSGQDSVKSNTQTRMIKE